MNNEKEFEWSELIYAIKNIIYVCLGVIGIIGTIWTPYSLILSAIVIFKFMI